MIKVADIRRKTSENLIVLLGFFDCLHIGHKAVMNVLEYQLEPAQSSLKRPKQRILIARALISNPDIIFFDEATSALDNISQKAVSDNLDQLMCTRVVIAHRLSTIRHCDRIIVLDKGKIAEQGTFEELMENKGLFYEMSIRQL